MARAFKLEIKLKAMLVPIGRWRFTLLVWENDYVRNLKSRASDRWGHSSELSEGDFY